MNNDSLLEYFNGDELAMSTWKNKYAGSNEVHPNDMHYRLAKEFAKIELEYALKCPTLTPGRYELLSNHGKEYYQFLQRVQQEPEAAIEYIWNYFEGFKKIIPGGSVMASLGLNKLSSLSNCFVIDSPKDSISGIMSQLNLQAQLMKYRGGVGFDISTLRPNGTGVKNSAKTSTGAASFMDLFSHVTNTIAQNGRRGALMLTINVKHPDIEEFIEIKQDLTKVTGANISVQVTNDFMDKVIKDEDFILSYPIEFRLSKNIDVNEFEYNKLIPVNSIEEGQSSGYIKKVKAKDIWNKIIKCAHNSAEPGILFIDNIHNYSPDGVYDKFKAVSTNPCGEIPLGPFDSCRLIHQNLTASVKNSFSKDAYIDQKTLYDISYTTMLLGDDLVDLEIEAIDKIIAKVSIDKDSNEIELWNLIKSNGILGRRIGCGFTGLADTLAMLNLAYDSEEALDVVNVIMENILKAQLDATIDLAILRGAFPAQDCNKEFDSDNGKNDFYAFIQEQYPEQYEKMVANKIGRRNLSWSTLAPTGTVSLLTQTSSGIEPVFLPYYMRRRKCSSPNDKVDYVDKVGEKYTEFFVLHPMFKQWLQLYQPSVLEKNGTLCKNITERELKIMFENSPWFKSTANDISYQNRIRMQGIIQEYTTHAISSTLNLPKDATFETIENIYISAWKANLKGVTIYREGSRDGILNSIESTSNNFNRQAEKRPKVLEADYYQIKSKGIQYIVLVGLLHEKPYEIFTFRPLHDVDIKPHKGTITKIKKGHYSYDSEYIHLDNLELANTNVEEKASSLYTSMLLRHHADINFIIKTAKKVNDNIGSFSSAMCRVLSKYVDIQEVKGEQCPQCNGTKLIRESGCVKCLDCDYSKCL